MSLYKMLIEQVNSQVNKRLQAYYNVMKGVGLNIDHSKICIQSPEGDKKDKENGIKDTSFYQIVTSNRLTSQIESEYCKQQIANDITESAINALWISVTTTVDTERTIDIAGRLSICNVRDAILESKKTATQTQPTEKAADYLLISDVRSVDQIFNDTNFTEECVEEWNNFRIWYVWMDIGQYSLTKDIGHSWLLPVNGLVLNLPSQVELCEATIKSQPTPGNIYITCGIRAGAQKGLRGAYKLVTNHGQ